MEAKVLRPYQVEAIDGILSSWKECRTTLAVMATGGGKTLVAAGVTKRLRADGQRVLYLANRNELCIQPLETFTRELGVVPALEKAEHRAPLSAGIVIGSVQTMSRKQRLARFPKDHFHCILCDEAHLSLAPSWQRIFEHFPGAKVCGVTATPFRNDQKLLKDVFESEAYRKNLFELVGDGWLVNPDNVVKLESAISLAQVRVKKTTEGVDFDLQDASDAIMPYFEAIAKELKREHANRHILAFLPLIASSKKFVAACVAEGLNAVHVDGEDPERDRKLQAFKDGQITLLSNSNLLHTGIDAPITDATLCLRPTRSKVLYQQVIGRSTRPLPGTIDGLGTAEARLEAIRTSAKPNALIIDPLWLSDDHDLCTPSFLIAENQEEAIEIHRKTGGTKHYNLQAVQAELQREREEAIARRLENAARFREGRVDYQFLAACTGEHKLLCYEPIYAKECRPPSPTSLRTLQSMGIDTQNITSEGLAEEVKKAIGRRRYKGLAEIRSLASLAETDLNSPLWTIKKTDPRLVH